MGLRQYLAIVSRWWWLLLLGLLIAAAPTLVITRSLPKVYRATTTLYINQSAAPGAITYSDALLNQQLVKTYSQMAQQPIVLDTVRQQLHLPYSSEAFDRMVTITPVRDTQLIDISVDGTNPAQVRDVANAIATVFIAQQQPYLPKDQVNSALRVAQPAVLPTRPIGPSTLRNAALAAVLGLLVAVGIVALLEYLDDVVKTPETLREVTGLATLGAVSTFKNQPQQRADLFLAAHPRSPLVEAYRLVRANLQFATLDRPWRTLLITSAGPGEGKSTTTANLGVALAQTGKRVLVMDADLRRPNLHKLFDVSNSHGLTTLLLADGVELENPLRPTEVENLWLLPSGPLPPDPAELLASRRMKALLERLTSLFDVVIVDTPPVLAVADPIVLAAEVDGTMLVVDTQRTRVEAARRAVEALQKSGTRVLGAVLNKLSKRSGQYYSYYYQEYAAATGSPPPAGPAPLRGVARTKAS